MVTADTSPCILPITNNIIEFMDEIKITLLEKGVEEKEKEKNLVYILIRYIYKNEIKNVLSILDGMVIIG